MTNKTFIIVRFLSIIFLVFSFLIIPEKSFASSNAYIPLAPIPNLINSSGYVLSDNGSQMAQSTSDKFLSQYFQSLYRFGVGIATGLALIMIVLGGVEYVSTDAIGGKEEGKQRIQNAVLGMLLALGSYLILQTIDQNFIRSDIRMSELKIKTSSSGGAKGGVEVVEGSSGDSRSSGSKGSGGSNSSGGKLTWDDWTNDDQAEFDAGGSDAIAKEKLIEASVASSNSGTTGGGTKYLARSTSRDEVWGSPDASGMVGNTVYSEQSFYSPNEKISPDSNSAQSQGAMGKLVEGTVGGRNILGQDLGTGDTVGSVGSVYYPAGTLLEIGGIRYVVDDQNITKKDGVYYAMNDHVASNNKVDIFTNNNAFVNKNDGSLAGTKSLKVLYVPPTKVGANTVKDIRNNPDKYIK